MKKKKDFYCLHLLINYLHILRIERMYKNDSESGKYNKINNLNQFALRHFLER